MTTTWADADAGSTFVFQSAGNEMAIVCPPYTGAAAAQLQGFSLAAGDTLDLGPILRAANLSITAAELGNFFSTTESNGSTLLWFNATGTGATPGNGTIVVAVLENTQVSMSQLLSASALNVGAPITPTAVQPLMHLGCTNIVLTYRLEGQETVCLQSPSHGVQQLAGFNAAMGDVIGVDDILKTTPVPANLAGVGNFITSTVSAAGTTLFFDRTGQGLQGSAFAVLQGVDTTVAQLVADGAMQVSPDPSSTNFSVLDTTTNTPLQTNGTPYSGPVAGLQEEFTDGASDNLNVTANVPNVFIHTGSGEDAIDVSHGGGNNVLDGSTGSNFLVGGSGDDTFFVDDRSPSADIWSTVANFHAGDAATIFGVTQSGFDTSWVDGQGATGFTGLTLHVTAAGLLIGPGHPTASLTLAGFTTADLSNGRISTSWGTEADGTPYLYVHANS